MEGTGLMYIDCDKCIFIAGHEGDHGPKTWAEAQSNG